MAESRKAVYGAIVANIAIAVIKFIVAGITASSAMLSEGIHSLVDTGNGVLLLVGIKLSKRKPSPQHPFGHGKELYFWSLIVAVLIFGVGGGLSAYEGIMHIVHPTEMRDVLWNYLVLAAAAVFEGISFTIALRQFRREKGEAPMWDAIHTSKDPTTYTILAEDSAALAGLVVAAVGVYASDTLGKPWIDGAASIVIGVILACVAVILIREAHGLLIGEGIRPDTAKAIVQLAMATPGIKAAGKPLSMYIGAHDALVVLDVAFDPSVSADGVASAVRRLEHAIRERYPRIKRIYVEPRSLSEAPQMTA
jgi:cation diffusion facilitator family transporter